ncbi:hypothetical protein BpHYR1_013320 [Brachionus plicatilis]|uniref:Uncharacterized protein n=1 Tax=Brachionus plicatilis TaxID=10195 RepID=A0A3M7QTE9_BRAPC|nr:hypothetical protein BpHYR1_013320 [Brachionus plicatilis]
MTRLVYEIADTLEVWNDHWLFSLINSDRFNSELGFEASRLVYGTETGVNVENCYCLMAHLDFFGAQKILDYTLNQHHKT